MATERDVKRLGDGMLRRMGARDAVEEIRRTLELLRMKSQRELLEPRPELAMHVWLAQTTAIKVVESKLEEIERQLEEDDRLLFAWMDQDLAKLRN